MPSNKFNVESIHYNSQCINFPEWISLITLCLAPLIAHIVSGYPQVSYIAHHRPKWHDYLCHYNPTSIIWRYAAITDRRVRANRWTRNDLAASNAIFWTTKGWNGGEDMVSVAAPHCLRTPEFTHVRIFSVTMLKTTITTLQGISALFSLIGALAGYTNINVDWVMGVDAIFLPLAILGLLRLSAAAWLTDDFLYSLRNDGLLEIPPCVSLGSCLKDDNVQLIRMSNILDPCLTAPPRPDSWFKSPNSSWPSRVFRTCYVLTLGGIWSISCLSFLLGTSGHVVERYYTTTSFLAGLFYFLFLTFSITLYCFYFFRGKTTTTLLPCISTTWYKAYTMLVMGFMTTLVVIAGIETNKAPTGLYTSFRIPEGFGRCSQPAEWWRFVPNSTLFGFATREEHNRTKLGYNHSSVPVMRLGENNDSLTERFWLYDFKGYCMGRLGDAH